MHRGYYTVSKRYGFYLRVAKISHEFSAVKRVRCCGHEKIKAISFGNRVMFSLLYGHRTSFSDFLKFSENLRKCSEIFGKLRKRFKSNFQMILRFLKFSEDLRKSSEIFGKLLKQFKSNLQMFL